MSEHDFFGWRRTGSLPYLSGGFAVGCIELTAPASTSAGSVPVLVFYPSLEAQTAGERPSWLTATQAEALGRAQLSDVFGEALAMFLMRHLGPLATGLLRVPAAYGLEPAPLPQSRQAEGWPVAVISHGLTSWPTAQAGLAASLCSHGAVVALVCHCDGTAACTAPLHPPCSDAAQPGASTVDVQYDGWSARRHSMEREGFKPAAIALHGEAWRRSQNEQRVIEIHAALDTLSERLQAAAPELFGEGFMLRTERDVAMLGHSFGGATAAACVLRDATRAAGGSRSPRFSHCFLYDPWLGGAAAPLSDSELSVRPVTSALRTMRVWLNDAPRYRQMVCTNAHLLVAKARQAGCRVADVVEVDAKSHYAQTDVPTVCALSHAHTHAHAHTHTHTRTLHLYPLPGPSFSPVSPSSNLPRRDWRPRPLPPLPGHAAAFSGV